MNDELKKYLQDILSCIEFIEKETGAVKLYKEYENNFLLKAAVERKLEIIGEAISRASKIEPNLPISNKEKIISTRNRIIHAYDAVDDIMIWEIVINHLPVLKKEIEGLLK
jgi:uncharacterized protein with HEPN domain